MTTAPRSRLGRGAVVVVLGLLAFAGCAPAPARSASAPPEDQLVPDRNVAGEWNRTLAEAVRQRDAAGCRRHFSVDTPAWFCDNLLATPVLVTLADPDPRAGGFQTSWCWSVGDRCLPHAWVLPYRVSGRDIRLTAPTTAQLRKDAVAPPWAVEATRQERVGDAVVLLAQGRTAPAGLSTAVATLAAYPFTTGPKPVLLYAFPSSRGSAETIAREPLTRTAALTVPAVPGERQPIVVLNPDEPSATSAFVLAHEGAHVRADTASWRHLWAAEGLADVVGLSADPDQRARSDEAVRAYVRVHGVPAALPTDAAFGGNETEAAYGLARIAVEVLVTHAGQARAMEILRQLATDAPATTTLDELTQWWRAELEARYR